jgi:hypothetical protein
LQRAGLRLEYDEELADKPFATKQTASFSTPAAPANVRKPAKSMLYARTVFGLRPRSRACQSRYSSMAWARVGEVGGRSAMRWK